MFPLRDGLPDLLQDLGEVLGWEDDSRVDQLDLWTESDPELLHQRLVLSDVLDGRLSLRVLADEIVFRSDGSEEGSERDGEVISRYEEGWRGRKGREEGREGREGISKGQLRSSR